MNPAATDPPAAAPPRSSFSCDRHPEEQFAGFCRECLCERLSGLDNPSSSAAAAAPRKSNAGGASIKAMFRGSDKSSNRNSTSSKPPSSFLAELRRTKSFSASKGEAFSGAFEPQRKSCDVRVRNNLWSLFNKDENERRVSKKETRVADAEAETKTKTKTLGFEPREEDENEDPDQEEEEEEVECMEEEEGGEIRVSGEAPNAVVSPVFEDCIEEIVEEEVLDELKPMKDHIDLHSQSKKAAGRDLKEIAGNFWSAASGFSKKLHKWGRKQKLKKQAPEAKRLGRRHHETQSEVADYGYGRRSCDIDPRFSLDVGRISLDDPRYSLDEPRASWDGYLIGKPIPRLPPMRSVVEDPPVAHISRTDNQILAEAPKNCANEDEAIPGGSAQTRDYYSDSSSRRRKSLDRSNSIRKTAAAVVAEMDEMKSVSNAKVSPATIDSLQGSKVLGVDKELGDSNSNSLRDDCSESFEMGFNGDQKAASKKSRRWKVWNIWGLIYRRNGSKDDDEGRLRRLNGVERSFSESWREFRREGNEEVKGGFNRRMFRSNSSVSSRHSYSMGGGGSFGSARKSNAEENGHGKKKRDECVLERNRSARYSPNNVENGLLRFYLTPLRGSRRSGSGKSRPSNSHSIARSVLGLY